MYNCDDQSCLHIFLRRSNNLIIVACFFTLASPQVLSSWGSLSSEYREIVLGYLTGEINLLNYILILEKMIHMKSFLEKY